MLKKNYFYNVALSITNILFPLLSFPYASRILGPHGIGKVQLAVSFAQYFAFMAALGIPIYGIQEIAKIRHNKKKLDTVFSELSVIYFVTSIVVSALYLIVIFTVPYFKPNIELFCYGGLIIVLGFSAIDWFYSGMEDFKTIAVRTVCIKLVSLVLLYCFVKNASDYKYYLFVTIFSMLGNNVINFIMVGTKTGFVMPGRQIVRHLKPLLYIFSTTTAACMYAILDTVLLGFLSNERSVGLYSAAVKVSKVAIPFITSAGLILIPQISKKMEENDHTAVQGLLDKAYQFIAFFSVPIAMGLILLAPECIYVFSGDQFAEATLSMQLVGILPVVIGFGYFFSFLVLVPGGKHKQMLVSALIGMFLSFALNFLLVPFYRHNGASIANAVCELAVTGLFLYFARKHFNYTYDWLFFFRSVVCSLSFIPLVLGIRLLHINAVLTLGLSVASCAAVYFLVQYFVFKNVFVVKVFNFGLTRIGLKKVAE
ncbi:MAG: flippase [Chitinophagaceae bacterium]|nr:flippase [Chitinophagaceae bacterium]